MLAQLIKRPFRIRVTPPATPNPMIADGLSTDMDERMDHFASIPGMLPRERGLALYCLAFSSNITGDIVEIGSWQGRSTCFFAQACRDSNNGIVRAIDHFKGNVGKEHHYAVGQPDLSDLEPNFRRNVAEAGLDPWVKLYNMPAQEAADKHTKDFNDVRLLFIDGDHSYEGVTRDISLFSPLLKSGGLIVFDDYHNGGGGVVKAVGEHILNGGGFDDFVQFPGVLIARKR